MWCVLSLSRSDGWKSLSWGRGLVLWIFRQIWSRCPLAVATVLEKCLLTLEVFTAGQVMKLFCLIAANHVDFTGLKHAAWRNFIWSLIQCFIFVRLFACGMFLKFGRMVQSPLGVQLPCKTCLPLYLMMVACRSKCAVQPLSQSWPMDTREFCNWGNMCALVAGVGRILVLIGSCAVWDDWMVVWSGRWTVKGWSAFVLFVAGVCSVRKCPLAPVSKMRGGARCREVSFKHC